MTSKSLYDNAFAFIKDEPWNAVDGDDVFAVTLPDGEIGYCRTLLDEEDEQPHLILYVGEAGLAALEAVEYSMNENCKFLYHEAIVQSQHLLCYFDSPKNIPPTQLAAMQALGIDINDDSVYPVFQKKEPGYFSHYKLSTQDEERLACALHGAIVMHMLIGNLRVSDGLLFQDDDVRYPIADMSGVEPALGLHTRKPAPHVLPSVLPFTNQIQATRLRKMQKAQGVTWRVEAPHLPIRRPDDETRFLQVFFIADHTNTTLDVYIVKPTDDAMTLSAFVASYMESHQKPAEILVRTEKTEALLSDLCRKIGVRLARLTDAAWFDEFLDNACDDILDQFTDTSEKSENAQITSAKKQTSQCAYCGATMEGEDVLPHVLSCEDRPQGTGRTSYLVLDVTAPYRDGFSLLLSVHAKATLQELDAFLRKTWLECCGHMSFFGINGTEYVFPASNGEPDMNIPLCELVSQGGTFAYAYDMGDTTDLTIHVADTYTAKSRPRKIQLMARNTLPEQHCSLCDKPAKRVYYGADTPSGFDYFCGLCARRMPVDIREMLLPYVNSPRTGICAYGLPD